MRFLITLVLLPACNHRESKTVQGTPDSAADSGWDPGPCGDDPVDEDFDGYPPCGEIGEADCNDHDGAIHPGADEYCDGIDNDCDNEIDEDAKNAPVWYPDNDGDEHGSAVGAVGACVAPDGFVDVAGDCDDTKDDLQRCQFSLGQAAATLIGEVEGDQAGQLVIQGEDGDGASDLIVGAYRAGSFTGAVYLVRGTVRGEQDLSDAFAKLVGEMAGDIAGHSAAVGDVDADGSADLLVGAPDAGFDYGGIAYLVLGPFQGTANLADADAKLLGQGAAGRSVATADIDGDGTADWFVGGEGSAHMVLGTTRGEVDLSQAEATLLGEGVGQVATAGDVDVDGIDDLLVETNDDDGGRNAGAVHLVLGSVRGRQSLSVACAKLIGEAEHDYAGRSVAAAGDVDGDGVPDLVVGAHLEDSGGNKAGAIYLVSGTVRGTTSLSSAMAKLIGEAGDLVGHSVDMSGDFDGDGVPDLLVAAPGKDGVGAAYLVSGTARGTTSVAGADALLFGETVGDIAGHSVAFVGDVNDDGMPDLLVGAPGHDAGGDHAGAAYLVLGGSWRP